MDEKFQDINPSEPEGIKAIIFLQALAGIKESEEEAKIGWREMTSYDQENTMAAYKVMGGNKDN